jgi:flagellar protein FliS
MNSYGVRALEGASGVELTIALYDGIVRFMHSAIEAVDRGDVAQRRYAVKRAMDIVIHLQATLKMDVGGKPAEALAEFYIAMFALMLQGSQANSREKFEQVIACVKNVREAWMQAAQSPEANLQVRLEQSDELQGVAHVAESAAGSHWNA